ncbi:hypothetical protein ACO2Q8_07525 [Larkinella sp. VNQ87]|uniref:hypothetical protein n=1 Tax=Larkinella sp. VNQ87 TaxID=3400921 RepID=UPI003C01315B
MKLFFTLVIVCLFTNVFSQSLLKPVVEIDVRSGAFSTSLPFDETFTIKGELTYSTRKVILKYGPLDKARADRYFAKKVNYTEKYKNDPILESVREYLVKKGETEFAFSEVGPLRPNSPYKFRFITLTNNRISTQDIKFLKQEINREVTAALAKEKVLNLDDLNSVYDELIELSSKVNQENNLVDGLSEPFDIKKYKTNLNLYSYRLLNLHNAEYTQKRRLGEAIDSMSLDGFDTYYAQILPKLTDLNAGAIRLSTYSRQALSSLKDRATQDETTLQQPLLYLQSILSDRSAFRQQILQETGSLEDSTLTVNPAILQNLIGIVGVLKANEFTKADNSRVFTTAEVNALEKVMLFLSQLQKTQKALAGTTQQLFLLKSEISDVLVRAYTEESFVLASVAEFDAIAGAGPYVSLDLGLLMAYNPYKNSDGPIGNNTYFAIQEGINIYFSPVNKRVPLQNFKSPYRFYKSFNMHLGFAQVLGGFDTYRFKNSLGRFLGNFVVGVGVRFNSVTKLGASAMFVRMNDINPTVSRSTLKPLFGLSLTCDLNAARIISNAGKRKNRN